MVKCSYRLTVAVTVCSYRVTVAVTECTYRLTVAATECSYRMTVAVTECSYRPTVAVTEYSYRLTVVVKQIVTKSTTENGTVKVLSGKRDKIITTGHEGTWWIGGVTPFLQLVSSLRSAVNFTARPLDLVSNTNRYF